MIYKCNGTESGDYYFIYNNTNYQFAMPTISVDDILTFNTTTLKLYKDTTEISTTTASAGTLITMSTTPNPDYSQDVHIVTGDNTIKIKSKNLFIGFSYSKSNSGVDYIYYPDGRITANGKATSSSNSMLSTNAAPYLFTIPPGQYTLSGGTEQIRIQFVSSTGGLLMNTSSSDTTTFNESQTGFIRLAISKNNTADNVTIYPMLEKNTRATSYEIGKIQSQLLSLGSIELAKIGDYADRIYKQDGKWWLEKKIGKKFLNGTEAWTDMNWKDPMQAYRTAIDNIKQTTSGEENPYIKTNYYQSYTFSILNSNSVTDGACNRNNQSQIIIRNDNITSTDAFKTWLTTHNLLVYYVLNNSIITEIIDTTLIGQLNNLEKIKSYNNQTNILQENADAPFIINATVLQQLT